MARSSRGPSRATTWATERHSRPQPRIVRLGRPANDNVRQVSLAVRVAAASLAALAALLALIHWHVF